MGLIDTDCVKILFFLVLAPLQKVCLVAQLVPVNNEREPRRRILVELHRSERRESLYALLIVLLEVEDFLVVEGEEVGRA